MLLTKCITCLWIFLPCREFCSESTFRRAYYSFLQQLQVKWVCKCPVCGDEPSILIGDATMITMSKSSYCGTPITEQSPGPTICLPGHRRAARSFMGIGSGTHKGLEHLAAYVKGTGRSARTVKSHPIPASWNYMYGLGIRDDSALSNAFTAFGSMSDAGLSSDARGKLAQFISCTASTSPVCSYFPTQVAGALQSCMDDGLATPSPQVFRAVQRSAPIVHAVLKVLLEHSHEFLGEHFTLRDPRWRALFRRLCTRSQVCHSMDPCGEGQLPDLPDPDEHLESSPSWEADTCLHSGVCCGVRRVRGRLPCAADAAPLDKQEACREPCQHAFYNAGDRTGGIFTWFCEHGVCYAVYIIPKAEGRDEAYAFLTGYFRSAPKVIVYDFSCALEEYCLNRAPTFFKDTLFVVDKFHWKNHVACAWGYCMSKYTFLDNLNSQLAEQCNSALKKIRPALGRMLQSNFMSAIRLYLHHWNTKKCTQVLATEQHRQELRGVISP